MIIIISILDIPFRGGIWYIRGYLADRDARIAGIQEEPEGQIEVLNVGDSLANIALTPVELYRDYGITSYVMGRDLQKSIETYYAIRIAKQTQPIKVVLWEVHNLCNASAQFVHRIRTTCATYLHNLCTSSAQNLHNIHRH